MSSYKDVLNVCTLTNSQHSFHRNLQLFDGLLPVVYREDSIIVDTSPAVRKVAQFVKDTNTQLRSILINLANSLTQRFLRRV